MRRTMKVVWKEDATGRELLNREGDNVYSVVVATCNAGTLAELGKAILDGLRGTPEAGELLEYAAGVVFPETAKESEPCGDGRK